MRFDIITLFPEMFVALNSGIVGRAIKEKLIATHYWDPRDYTTDRHKTVDDRPYGGGPGMVMKYQPLHLAIQAAKAADRSVAKVIYLSPQGAPLKQKAAACFAQESRLILLLGRYEGIDERLLEQDVDEQWSVGDYVVSGGELPAMLLIDAITRLLPGALGHQDSASQDTFSQGLFDCPHYTRPEKIGEQAVPTVLLSGDHKAIARWRLKQSLGKTWQKRRDLLKRRVLTAQEQSLLEEFIVDRG